ncbi:MAG: 4Fe-4S binding protein, partial [Deltaproteobacteria bacterium]|nr:4Fe-4S binding protein [Deltaproteobacteria bacterium]
PAGARFTLKPARGARDAAFPGHRLLRRLVVRRPVISFSRCRRCLVCVKHCPAGAMKLVDGRVRINYNRCIRCYCCQELCSHGAVSVRWGPGFGAGRR